MDPDYRMFWRHAFGVGIKGAHALRQRLDLNEDNFRFRAPYSHKNARNVYIYRALDEVQKAATCLVRWAEFFKEGKLIDADENLQKQIMRVTEQAVYDEQALRCRKLTETLVDTILFLKTNEDMYFRDYFYLNELSEYLAAQKDRSEFYGFKSRNSEHHIQRLKNCILRLEGSGLDFDKRWYLCHAKSIACVREPSLSSFRSRYRRISIQQGPEVSALLAKCYSDAYGHSRDVHFTAHDTSWEFSKKALVMASNKAALLMVNLILKLRELSLMPFDEPDDVMSEIRTHLETSLPYAELTAPKAGIGDYVLIGEDLAQVKEERRSKYGYLSYQVRYVSRPPIPSIGEDWFACFQVFRLGSRAELLERAKTILSKYTEEKAIDGPLAAIDDAYFEQLLKQSIHDLLKHLRRDVRAERTSQ